jgi:glycine/D-amino acid oxidase-like deaminating enzyme
MSAEHAQSLWLSTAAIAPPKLPQLDRDVSTDVAIIGAGYTGLAAAHHLSGAGVECLVIDANDAGWGASGRNGGMAVPRYKKSWSSLAQEFGRERTRHLHRLVYQAVDLLEQTVAEYGIACGFSRDGHITAAHNARSLEMLKADVQWLTSEGGDRIPRLIVAGEVAALSGASGYIGGYLDTRAAGIHPLEYARGLATALAAKGVTIYVGSAVERLREESDGVVLETTNGVVRAKQALIATNAYTGLTRYAQDIDSRVVPVPSSIVTTVPLDDSLLARVLPARHLMSDTRRLVNYYRIAPGNRLLYGGRGALTGHESPDAYRGLEGKLRQTFPALADVAIDHRWSGKVAVTLDGFPHVGRTSPRVAYALGYGGRGVALTNLLGKFLAHIAMGELIDAGPMSGGAFTPIPLHQLRSPAVKVVAGCYRVLDALKL